MPTRLRHFAAAASLLALAPTGARALDSSPVAPAIDARVAALEGTLVEWRRHLHEHPELSNREVETERYVAERLRAMGLSPRTGIAGHGVVAVIEGRLPGATVALRSDMDALPVAEEVDLPFASRATGTFEERTVPVMHACGHDAHMSMLLVAAEALVAVRDRLPGRVVLLFQPAEEGVPIEEQPAGAEAMVRDGVLDDPKVDAVFGLHVFAGMTSGVIGYRPGPALAAADRFEIVVEGKQAHGSKPWAGVDPIVAASEIVGALQTIVSRQIDLTKEPAVVSVGQFESGVRNNIIPDRARLVGTIRTFDEAMRDEIHAPPADRGERRGGAGGARRGHHRARLSGHRERPRAHAGDAADPRARRARAGARGRQDHRGRGLRLLRPARSRALPLPRHHAGGRGVARRLESLPQVLRRRVGPAGRRPGARAARRRLALRRGRPVRSVASRDRAPIA